MALIESLTLKLAPSVAKFIFKLWCKDEVADIGADLVRVVAGKTKDVMMQQKIKRQIEEIGERVTQNLIPYFEAKEGKLSEYEKNTVVLCLEDVIGSAKLSSELLVENDLDPAKVSEYLLGSYPSVDKSLTTEEMKLLYRSIINEVSQNVVDIASQFPTFTEKGLSELLKRENLLLQVTGEILQEVKSIREGSRLANSEDVFAEFEAEYRRAVVRKLDIIQLFGTTLSDACKRHRLSVAYITLSVDEGNTKLAENKNVDDEVESKLVAQAIAGKQHVLITGIAGSGKTTLFQWLAVNCARKTHAQSLEELNGLIPFFIRLRQCVEGQFPSPEKFPTFIAPNIAATMPPTWVHRLLKEGRALVLIDGIDEIASEYRAIAREWVEDLIDTYQLSRFFVTSRPHAVEGGWINSKYFYNTQLIPMDLPDILSFVEHWHESVKETLLEDDDKAELKQQESGLKMMLRSNRSLMKLATNPLLCSMICALNRDRQQQLPSDRIELYNACSELLLERRDVERRVILTDYPKIGLRGKLALLEQFGYWLIRNELTMTSKEKTVEFLDAKIKDFPSFPDKTKGSQVLRLFVERTGMLREPVTGQIDFTHRTFQEFFAAKAALDNDDIGLLIKNAHDDQWREVVILAAGRGSKRQSEDIVAGLIKRGDDESEMRHQLHLVAVECLSTTVELNNSIMTEVKSRLKNLMPRNISEAKAIASAGDLAVQYLVNKKNRLSTISVACLRALSLIGTDAAKAAIKTYAGEDRKTVVKEIVRASRLFEDDEFAALANTFGVGNLSFNNIDSLTPICKIGNLRVLQVLNCNRVKDIESVVTLQKLRRLTLYLAPRVQSLTPLKELKNLDYIDLHYFPKITDLSVFQSLDSLDTACLSRFDAVEDMKVLGSLVDLDCLEIENCWKLANIEFIGNLSNLTKLKLVTLKGVNDYSPLRNLHHLKSIEFKDISTEMDFNIITNNSVMNVVSLQNMKLTQFQDVQKLTELRKLALYQIVGIGTLPQLPCSITDLSLVHTDVDNIDNLQSASSLKRLNITHSGEIKNIFVLAELKELKHVTLRGPFVGAIKGQVEALKAEHMGKTRFTVIES